MDTSNNQTPKEAQTPEARTKKGRRIAIVLIVLIVIGALASNGVFQKKDSTTDSTSNGLPEGCKPGYLFSETTGKPCPQPEENKVTDEQAVTASAYEEAIRMYGGKLVVLDAQCKALPAVQTLATGTRILIANNSTKQRTVATPDRTEVLDGYHYFTYKLGAPGEISITCDGAASAKITIAANK